MAPYYVIEKKVSETPLQAIARLRELHSIPIGVPLAYAGRLDPMASGKLLILAGEECKRQAEYHGLDKEYRFEVLFGCTSDTGDILGIPTYVEPEQISDLELSVVAKKLQGTISLPYPAYSSKTVKGKPLFLWTLEGRLDEIELPFAHTYIYRLSHVGTRTASADAIKKYVHDRIEALPLVQEESKKLGADFRRAEILPAWDALLEHVSDLQVASFIATVSSGTYIRSLAPHIAALVRSSGLAYSIHRTHIGRYLPIPLFNTGIWTKTYR